MRPSSPFPPMRRHAAVAAATLLAVVSAACGSGESGVSVKRLDADVVFGIKEQTTQQAARSIAAVPVEAEPDEEVRVLAPQAAQQFSKPRFRTDLFATDSCPPAALNAFPEKAATEQVPVLPEPGLYRWRRSGTERLKVLNNQEVAYTGFELRLLHRVVKISETQNPTSEYDDKRNIVYRYETVQPFLDGIRQTTYQVKTNAEVQRQASPFTGQRVRAGDPERGLVIKRIVTQDRQGNTEESVFESGLLILPLPVSPGETFTSVAKGTRGDALTFDGTVGTRQRVDACGEIIEGFRVTGKLTADGFSPTWSFLVAPQYGAILIEEQYKYDSQAGTHNPVFTVGQVKPRPFGQDRS
ncbi:MAG: hypothetical protein KY443_04935 [Actinobacteria bacterium]|nr:hypothetical protein [Actinomycetota bacterium]